MNRRSDRESGEGWSLPSLGRSKRVMRPLFGAAIFLLGAWMAHVAVYEADGLGLLCGIAVMAMGALVALADS